jgi:hypothetical protein
MEKRETNMARQDEEASGAPQGVLSREELELHVRARAWKDEAFRQEFLINPKTVLERDYTAWFPEGNIPAELSIKVIEEEEQTLCFVLSPKAPDHLSEINELDEDEALVVSGGIHTNPLTCYTMLPCITPGSRCCRIHASSEALKRITL